FVFFVISGFLVTQSWERAPSVSRFAMKRTLRIFPALAACILGLTFILGPIISTLPLGGYLSSYGTYDFLLSNLLLHTDHNSLPGVWFTARDLGHIVDGPLWSLPVEVAMYVMVAAMGAARLMRIPVLLALLAAGLLAIVAETSQWRDWSFTGSVLWLLA